MFWDQDASQLIDFRLSWFSVSPASKHSSASALSVVARQMAERACDQWYGSHHLQVADGREPGGATALQNRLWAQDPPLPERQQIQSYLQHYVVKLKFSREGRAFPSILCCFYDDWSSTEIKIWPPLSSLKIAHFLFLFLPFLNF